MSKKVPEWKEFEDLVARMESILAPQGAVVKSPDWIPDVNFGELREVDASIRMKVGSADVLITVECRKRGKVQDVRWIEELSAKKESIGAAKTLAVSSKGFSDLAIKTARLKGIELRQISDVSDQEIAQIWLSLQIGVTRVQYGIGIVGVELDDGMFLDFRDLDPRVRAELAAKGVDGRFCSTINGDPITLTFLLSQIRAQDPNFQESIGFEGAMTARFEPNTVWILTEKGERFVSEIRLELEWWSSSAPINQSRVLSLAYSPRRQHCLYIGI
jgi:hypothetical protein